MNPVVTRDGLSLNISKEDNRQDLNLVMNVAHYFRVEKEHACKIV